MPNWCTNVTHINFISEKAANNFEKEYFSESQANSLEKFWDFNKIVPIEKNASTTNDIELQRIAWGTKWSPDVIIERTAESITLHYNTPWTPPSEIISFLHLDKSQFGITSILHESIELGNNYGYIYKDGEQKILVPREASLFAYIDYFTFEVIRDQLIDLGGELE